MNVPSYKDVSNQADFSEEIKSVAFLDPVFIRLTGEDNIKAYNMCSQGMTKAEIAKNIGVSISRVSPKIKKVNLNLWRYKDKDWMYGLKDQVRQIVGTINNNITKIDSKHELRHAIEISKILPGIFIYGEPGYLDRGGKLGTSIFKQLCSHAGLCGDAILDEIARKKKEQPKKLPIIGINRAIDLLESYGYIVIPPPRGINK